MKSYKKLDFVLAVMAVLLFAIEISPALASGDQGGLPIPIVDDGKTVEKVDQATCALNGQTCFFGSQCCSGCFCDAPPVWPPVPGRCVGSCPTWAPIPGVCSGTGGICLWGLIECCGGCQCDAPAIRPPVPGRCTPNCPRSE